MSDVTPIRRWRHDLKNQLGIVLGFSELLLNEVDAASPHKPDVAEIHAAALRALELVANMPDDPDGAGAKDLR
jgi:hypothetical protein